MNGYNFTERVRKVLAMAREEAARLHHEYVGTEHVLLGVIREGEGVAATVLQNLGADLDALAATVNETVKHGKNQTVGPDLPYTSRAKKVLELAMSEARELNHSYVGTEHLLLGLLAERKGIAAQVLTHVGVTLEKARAETRRILGEVEARFAPGERPANRMYGFNPSFGSWTSAMGTPTPAVSERLRVVLSAAQDVAAEGGSLQLRPIHIALALVQHSEGLANAVLDRLGCDRVALLQALDAVTVAEGSPAEPEQILRASQEVVALHSQIETERRALTRGSPNTLHLLQALLATNPEIEEIFNAQGLTLDRVRTEGRRISG